MLLFKVGSDFVYDNVNSTVGLTVSYLLDSVKYYMQWPMIHFIAATPDFKIIELKVAAFEPLARGRVNKIILSQTNQTHTLHLLIKYV